MTTISIPTDRFTYTPGQFVAELSDLIDVFVGGRLPREFFLKSTKTDDEVLMQYTRDERDLEGEILATVYMPVRRGAHNPFRLTILND